MKITRTDCIVPANTGTPFTSWNLFPCRPHWALNFEKWPESVVTWGHLFTRIWLQIGSQSFRRWLLSNYYACEMLESLRCFDLGWDTGFPYVSCIYQLLWMDLWMDVPRAQDMIIFSLVCLFVPKSLPFLIFGKKNNNKISTYKFSNSSINDDRLVTRINVNLTKKVFNQFQAYFQVAFAS